MSSIDNNKQETEYEIIKRAKDEFSVNKFVMMFSGGKDSLTTAHFLYDKLDIDFELLYCDTGIGLKENRDYVKSISKKYGWKLNIVDPLPHETYEIFIKRFGFPYGGIHQVIMGFLKYHPMRKWYREQRKLNPEVKIGLCSGRRRLESARRKKMKSNRPILDTEKMIFICPIYYWSDKQVWDYIKTEKLGLCSVYDTLHISGDCLCGAYGTQDEYDLMKIFLRK
jgi:3'-phosphoadenosine 5'-phosphosulfate sulfotransferase (PAPS reductase)/FAD synthetase